MVCNHSRISIVFQQVRCYDWDSDSSNDLIGEFYTTLAELTDAASESGKVVLL